MKDDPKTMILADAIEQAIKNNRRVIRLRRTLAFLATTNIIFLILLVVSICD